jgi:hypothetical protein
MNRLALVSTLVGVFVVATRLPGVVAPAQYREHLLRFPRSVMWGRVLMGIAALIAWVVMYRAAADDWAWARPFIIAGVPVAYWVVIRYAGTFLAMRASAALMLIVAKQMVDAADLSDLPARLIVTVFAYVWVVAAIWITIAPHHFRDLMQSFMADDKRCRLVCSVGVLVGVLFLALGLFVCR